ncbi:MAG: hypothetical protein LBQ83_02460 [Candidatus Margulisbacteria bacterium]|jgi:ribosome-associated translation inhibitor RaiA|nr:hypothetical protein [Candidatus Margulisiibacteriota bacterium]
MSKSLEILNFLENISEDEKLNTVKNNYQLNSERNARAILHILENSQDAEKYPAKIEKVIKKLEDKLDKEHKRLAKKQESFAFSGFVDKSRVYELSSDILELKRLLE